MRLVCPHCDAAYDVTPSLLVGRRAVRCARCTREWVETAGTPKPIPEPIATPIPGPIPGAIPGPIIDAPASPPKVSGSAVRLGWAGSVLLLALGAWSAVAWRNDVMHAWPPSGRVYSALRLAGR